MKLANLITADLVDCKQGEPMTDSLRIAEKFGKNQLFDKICKINYNIRTTLKSVVGFRIPFVRCNRLAAPKLLVSGFFIVLRITPLWRAMRGDYRKVIHRVLTTVFEPRISLSTFSNRSAGFQTCLVRSSL